MNATRCFRSIHSTKIQRNIENLVEIHSTKFSKEISLNEKRERSHLGETNVIQLVGFRFLNAE
jgi:hypothetical protein